MLQETNSEQGSGKNVVDLKSENIHFDSDSIDDKENLGICFGEVIENVDCDMKDFWDLDMSDSSDDTLVPPDHEDPDFDQVVDAAQIHFRDFVWNLYQIKKRFEYGSDDGAVIQFPKGVWPLDASLPPTSKKVELERHNFRSFLQNSVRQRYGNSKSIKRI